MKKIIKIEELQKCSCFNLRFMARELTNKYNDALKYSEINSTQIPILAILNIYGQMEILTKLQLVYLLVIMTLQLLMPVDV